MEKYNLYNSLQDLPNVTLSPRMGFLAFNNLMSQCDFIVTDGGSNQEEAAFMGVPCLLMRTETERQDGLGKNVVLSSFNMSIIDDFIENYNMYRQESKNTCSPTQIILESIESYA